ncbi:hypothetical protein [Micromonospora marina]|uniref:hypothetical protein n=1 Tax=Micromonospora marina TaxID=307120 RepID=UPI003D739964
MSTTPPSGVTVAYCDGHRCRALRERGRNGGPEDLPDHINALRAAVRSSRDAVLIRADCLGACHRAPAVLLTGEVTGGRPALIGPIETAHRWQAVVDAIREADGPAR